MEKYSAIPRDKQIIRQLVNNIRKDLGIPNSKPFPIIAFVENILPNIDDDFTLDVVEDRELKDAYAKTYPEDHRIIVRRSVYEGACKKDGKCRVIMAHEVGHYIMHKNQMVCFAKSCHKERMSKEYSIEWQADIFAYELIMPISVVMKTKNHRELSKACWASAADAKKRIDIINQEIRQKKNREKKKAKSYSRRFGKR